MYLMKKVHHLTRLRTKNHNNETNLMIYKYICLQLIFFQAYFSHYKQETHGNGKKIFYLDWVISCLK
ncbi:hypothetical protein A6J88_00425 [Neisseria mucosa]|uniref:Uncharacterized protein n=1 Tax=Neisseria mucosa TaxID=488 RepID=A0ABM6J913_NEIMU|nr:hypothetical protein A6J88_00425 [Neisseria mucosa]